MVTAYRYPRGTRNRPLQPHRLVEPTRAQLVALAEYMRATAAEYGDDARWTRAADALDAAADALRGVL